LVIWGGCSDHQRQGADAPRAADPAIPPVHEETAAVSAADLGVEDSALVPGCRTIEAVPSSGRFPTGLSVAFVEAVADENGGQRHLRLAETTEPRKVRWVRTLEDLPSLREVRMLRTYGFDPRSADFRRLLESSIASDCGLCLIYAQAPDTQADAEFVAVLWDAASEKSLAAFRVPAVLPLEVRRKYNANQEKDLGRLRAKAQLQAEADLRRLVRDTLWDLVAKDGDLSTTQPNPWQADLPLFPRDLNSNLRIYLKDKSRR
jgi:hypothetical protein